MKNIEDLKVVELVCSHLCHELVSPVGAISNGLEMIEEFGGEPDDAVLGLIADSAAITAQRLQYYRAAYGVGGAAIELEDDFKALAEGLLKSGKSEIEWPAGPLLDGLAETHVKVLLNVIGLAANTLPRGGRIVVQTQSATLLTVMATGEQARVSEDVVEAMREGVSISSLSPRNIHAYFCQSLLGRLSQRITILQERPDQVNFSWRL